MVQLGDPCHAKKATSEVGLQRSLQREGGGEKCLCTGEHSVILEAGFMLTHDTGNPRKSTVLASEVFVWVERVKRTLGREQAQTCSPCLHMDCLAGFTRRRGYER